MKIKNKYSGLRDFFILWSSQAVSELGTAMTNFALIIWVYSQEGTASSITFLTLCSFLPTILDGRLRYADSFNIVFVIRIAGMAFIRHQFSAQFYERVSKPGILCGDKPACA